MKYTIIINQKAIIDNGLNLDLIDCAIIDYVKDFYLSGKMSKLNVPDKGEFFWVQYEHLLKEMPILGINNKRVLSRRMDKITDSGIFRKHIVKGNSSYFQFTEKLHLLISDSEKEVCNKNVVPVLESTTPCTEEYNPPVLKSTSINNIISNDIIKDNNIISKDITESKDSENIPKPKKEYIPKPITQEIDGILLALKNKIGCTDFKESKKEQRIWGNHNLNLMKSLGREEYVRRLAALLGNSFHSGNMGSLKYIYKQIKGYVEPKETKLVMF